MDQNVMLKLRGDGDEMIKEGALLRDLVSGFVKEFLIRRVSIITFRYDHCFYVGFIYY